MNGKRAKELRRMAYGLAAEWMKSMIPEDQHHLVTTQSVKEFEKDQESHIYANGVCRVSAYSSRYFYKQLKKAWRNSTSIDFRVKEGQLG